MNQVSHYSTATRLNFPPSFIDVNPAFGEANYEVFSIRSNVIQSWIQYSIKISNGWKISSDQPVFGFRKRPSGSVREMNFLARRYYGIESQVVVNHYTVEVKLKALPSRTVIIEVKKNKK